MAQHLSVDMLRIMSFVMTLLASLALFSFFTTALAIATQDKFQEIVGSKQDSPESNLKSSSGRHLLQTVIPGYGLYGCSSCSSCGSGWCSGCRCGPRVECCYQVQWHVHGFCYDMGSAIFIFNIHLIRVINKRLLFAFLS